MFLFDATKLDGGAYVIWKIPKNFILPQQSNIFLILIAGVVKFRGDVANRIRIVILYRYVLFCYQSAQSFLQGTLRIERPELTQLIPIHLAKVVQEWVLVLQLLAI